jgi:hypothetical protein
MSGERWRPSPQGRSENSPTSRPAKRKRDRKTKTAHQIPAGQPTGNSCTAKSRSGARASRCANDEKTRASTRPREAQKPRSRSSNREHKNPGKPMRISACQTHPIRISFGRRPGRMAEADVRSAATCQPLESRAGMWRPFQG